MDADWPSWEFKNEDPQFIINNLEKKTRTPGWEFLILGIFIGLLTHF